jgi:hypothetical protein
MNKGPGGFHAPGPFIRRNTIIIAPVGNTAKLFYLLRCISTIHHCWQ